MENVPCTYTCKHQYLCYALLFVNSLAAVLGHFNQKKIQPKDVIASLKEFI